MNRKRIGIWLARRVAVLVGLSTDMRTVVLCIKVARAPRESADKSLEKLLLNVLPEWRAGEIRIAVSPGDLACCDCFEIPFRNESEIESTAPSIIESRCAGENAEELAMDIRRLAKTPSGSRVQAIAIRQANLEVLRKCVTRNLPDAELRLITGASSILSQMIVSKAGTKGVFVLALSESREAHFIAKEGEQVLGWRGFSFDYASPNFAQQLQTEAAQFGAGEVTICTTDNVPMVRNVLTEPAHAVAMAAALVDPKHTLDLLRGAQDAPKSSIARLRMPVMAACVAIIAFCVAVGIHFQTLSANLEKAIADAETIERQLGQEYLHGEKPDADGLTAQMNKQLLEHTKRLNSNRFPSVLSFWSEVAQALPNPEKIGLVTDSLQLNRDEGRLVGHVSRGQDDALKNASLLEANLNRSGQLSAHGEFETKDSEILVRFRMDYHPKKEPVSAPRDSEVKP